MRKHGGTQNRKYGSWLIPSWIPASHHWGLGHVRSPLRNHPKKVTKSCRFRRSKAASGHIHLAYSPLIFYQYTIHKYIYIWSSVPTPLPPSRGHGWAMVLSPSPPVVWWGCGTACIYIYIMYVCMYVGRYVCMCMCICMYACMHACMYVCMCIYILIYIYIYLFIYVYIYMCIYIHIYIHVSIIEGSLEVKLPTIWRDEKQSRAEAERRGRLEREDQKRKSKKTEDTDARKGKKVAKHCVFPVICGSGGRKSRLAKAAGAEPAGHRSDEKLHAVVVRSTFRSQKC